MAATREHETEIARLQSRLGDLLARLDAIDPDAHEYRLAADDAIAAAGELIDYEDRLPRLLDERPRQLTMIILRGCGAATMALAAAIALGVVPGGRPWWWLPIAVLLAVAGARLLMTRVRRSQSAQLHLQQRPPALLVLAGALAAGVAELGLLTAPLVVVAVVLVVAGVTLSLPRTAVQLRDLSSGQRIDVEFDSDLSDPAPGTSPLDRDRAPHESRDQL